MSGEALQVTDEEMDDLVKLAQMSLDNSTGVSHTDVDDLYITPGELYDNFFVVRQACGGWRIKPPTEGEDDLGEALGKLQTLISGVSSPDSSETLDNPQNTGLTTAPSMTGAISGNVSYADVPLPTSS
jgi:hypothetical protein